ncbi:hypothetical protein [Streptomyces sp. AS02]|uniref:hypothetical protein n=1 Tax=Streptomyces sp. AS02 TaxID=2938946 RepID=UPI002021C046|nr:hypothetical protein [Streptomyces sp. AS02]MCL8013265.1 hypothetical protein [Streptomyces sp. AS02]
MIHQSATTLGRNVATTRSNSEVSRGGEGVRAAVPAHGSGWCAQADGQGDYGVLRTRKGRHARYASCPWLAYRAETADDPAGHRLWGYNPDGGATTRSAETRRGAEQYRRVVVDLS